MIDYHSLFIIWGWFLFQLFNLYVCKPLFKVIWCECICLGVCDPTQFSFRPRQCPRRNPCYFCQTAGWECVYMWVCRWHIDMSSSPTVIICGSQWVQVLGGLWGVSVCFLGLTQKLLCCPACRCRKGLLPPSVPHNNYCKNSKSGQSQLGIRRNSFIQLLGQY